VSRGRRRSEGGQALVETAVTLPILLILFFGFLAAGVGAQGYIDLNTAVYLAAASNVTAYADDPAQADAYAEDTFRATIAHDSLLEPDPGVGVPGHPGLACSPDYGAGARVTCTGTAHLRFSRTALGALIPIDPRITAQATAIRSLYRSAPPPSP
jgi:Flp pilus assembly protein TadG